MSAQRVRARRRILVPPLVNSLARARWRVVARTCDECCHQQSQPTSRTFRRAGRAAPADPFDARSSEWLFQTLAGLCQALGAGGREVAFQTTDRRLRPSQLVVCSDVRPGELVVVLLPLMRKEV